MDRRQRLGGGSSWTRRRARETEEEEEQEKPEMFEVELKLAAAEDELYKELLVSLSISARKEGGRRTKTNEVDADDDALLFSLPSVSLSPSLCIYSLFFSLSLLARTSDSLSP